MSAWSKRILLQHNIVSPDSNLPPSLPPDVLYLPNEVEWVKFNVNMSGYYMVHYAGDGWSPIIELLRRNHTALSGNDRASLIHNVFQLVRSVPPAGRLSRSSPRAATPRLLCRVAVSGR